MCGREGGQAGGDGLIWAAQADRESGTCPASVSAQLHQGAIQLAENHLGAGQEMTAGLIEYHSFSLATEQGGAQLGLQPGDTPG